MGEETSGSHVISQQASEGSERARGGSGPGRPLPRRRRELLLVVVACTLSAGGFLLLALGGCQGGIRTEYGQRRGESWSSVNGTGVLGEMFEQAGHTVYCWQMLTPRLRGRADCIVWFPDDFHPPSADVCQWLENWLRESPGRTLVYVGRDFDAGLYYWERILPGAPPEQKKEITRRREEARRYFLQSLRTVAKEESCDWFTLKSGQKHRQVRSLQGKPEWTEGIDPAGLEIELNHRLVPAGQEVLLSSEGDVLVAARPFGQSRLILVANGSFLLNLPLVNHEHRKLAGQLVEEIGPRRQTVVFLESGPGGPLVLDADPDSRPPSGLEVFQVWPASWILLHLAVAGIILCFSRFPIFGRPRELEPEGASDFGRHVAALGELLQRSGDVPHAAARLAQYRQLARPESARSIGRDEPRLASQAKRPARALRREAP